MTDTRLDPGFLTHPLIEGLTSDAYRVYVNGLVACVSRGTDGRLHRRDLRLLHPDGARLDDVNELVRAGLWLVREDGYEVRHFLRYQTPAAEVERHKELARERKRRERERKLKAAEDRVTRDGTGDGSRDERETPPRTGRGTGTGMSVTGGDEKAKAWTEPVAQPGSGLRAVVGGAP